LQVETSIKKYIIKINLLSYKNKNFEEIHNEIYNICKEKNGLGNLVVYDITAAICRYYNINIEKVYIIGSGPRRAIKLLNLKTKRCKKINANYVEISEVLDKFQNDELKNCINGDILESFLCNWQKEIL
jgi:hypothetical protein